MGKKLAGLVLVGCFLSVQGALFADTWEYWFPWVHNQNAPGANSHSSRIKVKAVECSTTTYVWIDLNYDLTHNGGEPDASLNPGEEMSFGGLPSNVPICIASDQPVAAWYTYTSNNTGIYDDCPFAYSPVFFDTLFYVPMAEDGTVYIVAFEDNTNVSEPSGVPVLNRGDRHSFAAVAETRIRSDKPVGVMIGHDPQSNSDYTYATAFLPVSMFSTKCYLPQDEAVHFQNISYAHRRALIVTENGDTSYMDLPAAPQKVITTDPSGFYYWWDVYAQDPWGGNTMRNYSGLMTVLPVSELGETYCEYGAAWAVLSTADNCTLMIDADYNCIFEDTVILAEAETYNAPYWRASGNADFLYPDFLGHIRASVPVYSYFVRVGDWDNISEKIYLFEQRPMKFTPMGVSEELRDDISLSLRVFPNPSRFGETVIHYSLPRKTRVCLRVYDISGKLVKNLFSGKAKGYHAASLNAKDFASGIYFVRLETKEFLAIKKLIVIH